MGSTGGGPIEQLLEEVWQEARQRDDGEGATYIPELARVDPDVFGLGLAMQARLDVKFGLEDPLAVLINVCQMATGAFYLAARGAGLAAGDVHAPSFEYGNTFTAVAGLLNMLAVLDAYDVAVGRK